MSKYIFKSNSSIKLPFTKLNIGKKLNLLKNFINASKEKIGQETDRLSKLDLNNKFIDKMESEKRKKIHIKKYILKNSIFNSNNKNNKEEFKNNNINNKKENNKIIINTKKLKINLLKNLLLRLNNNNFNKKNDDNNKEKYINKSFEGKNPIIKQYNTYRKNYNKSYSHKKLDNLKKNNSLLITNNNCANNIRLVNINKKKQKISRIKSSINNTSKCLCNINDSINNITKDLNQKIKINHFKREFNFKIYNKLLNSIKKEKKYGKSYDVLGPLEKSSIISLKKYKTNSKGIWMNRTTANILSFGEIYLSMQDELCSKERNRIIKDYLFYKNEAIPTKKYRKTHFSSDKTLALNLNKIEKMIESNKNIIRKINNYL